jgi:hypothetical protein
LSGLRGEGEDVAEIEHGRRDPLGDPGGGSNGLQ